LWDGRSSRRKRKKRRCQKYRKEEERRRRRERECVYTYTLDGMDGWMEWAGSQRNNNKKEGQPAS
jgi:hypothetical protein